MFGYGPHALKRYYNDIVGGWMIFFKRPEQGKALYEDSLRLYPSDAHAKNCIATLYANNNQNDLALKFYGELAVQQPKEAAHVFNQAFLHDSMGNVDKSIELFLATIAIDPSFDRAWYGLALNYISLRRFDDAIDALKRNIKLQPMSPYGYYQLAVTYMHQGNAEEAHKIHKQLQQFEPKFARGLKVDLEAMVNVTTHPTTTANA
jgi:tetratricopeptide (TPR) repeat protein